MPTSGTATFNPTIVDLMEEAHEQAGLEMYSAYDMRTARNSLNIMMLEWQNKGVNLWTVEENSFSTVQGTATYTLNPTYGVIDVLEHTIRTNDGLSSQADTPLDRISLTRYTAIPDKLTQGKPTMAWFDRQASAPRLTLYPVPDANSYKVYYWIARRIQDVGASAGNNMDIPPRFIPAIVAGLALRLAQKKVLEIPELKGSMEWLKMNADQTFQDATAEDREKVSVRVRPGHRYMRGVNPPTK